MKKRIRFFIFAFTLFQFLGFIHGAIPTSERAALIALYNSTNGDNWINNSGWKTPPLHTDGFAMPGTEGSWYGVTVTTDQVIGLNLDNNMMGGSIPPQLGNLSRLSSLVLHSNQISGSIPPELGNLSQLRYLRLNKNQLSGSIFPEIGNLSKLFWLDLSNNQLSGSIPPELGNLSQLESMHLIGNQLSGSIPSQLGNLNQLRELWLYGNKLSGSIPPQLGNLSQMYWLDLASNQLSGSIPPELGNLSSLRILYLYNNQLSGSIPIYFDGLRNLERLWLKSNQLSGNIPSVLGNLSKLQELILSYNKLSGCIPSNLMNLTNITSLNIYVNCLYATDPSLIAWLDSHNPGWENYQGNCGSGTTPTVTTISVSSITSNSAVCGGNVTSDGGSTVTARGVCWSTSSNPTTSNSKTTDGSGTGGFTSSITGLNPSTTYYIRAYATNNNGTSYGSNVSFTTNPASTTTPTVTTNPVSSITSNSAVCGGNVTSDGGSPVTARGVCWSTNSNPTTNTSKTIDGSGTGSFTSTITGLSASTTYYVRAYAINSKGTSYGSNVSFTTNPTSTTTPTVTTNPVSSITYNSVVCGGNVTSDGGSPVTARGVCWSTNSNPTINNSKTIDGSGTGSFTSTITGLSASTTYYVRAYATNSKGTSYGSNVSFTTNPTSTTTPTVTTDQVYSITSNSAVCGGNVTSDGGSPVTARGVCWSTSSNPTTSNSKTTDGSGTGSFTSSMSGLNPSTTYYVRAYATNSKGTSYGSEVSFNTTGGTTQSLKVGNLTFYANSISQLGNIYTLSGNVNINNALWFSDNIVYTAGSSTTGTMLSMGYPFVKLSKGNQYIFTATDLTYNVNGVSNKLTPLTGISDFFYAIYLTGIPLGISTDPIVIKEDSVLISGKLSIGSGNYKLCIVNVEVILKPGDKIYLEKASLSLDTSSLIPGIKVTSIRLEYNGDNDELTGSANIEFPFLGLTEIEASISVQPGCIDGFSIAVALKKAINLGTTGLTINGFIMEVDNICTPSRFKIFFGGDLGISGISSDIFLLKGVGLGYVHPFRLNLEGGTVKFLKYPVAHLSGYIDASDDINKTGVGIYGNIDFGGFYVADVDLKLLTKLLKFNGSARGVLQIPDFACDTFKCHLIKTIITNFIGLPYKIADQEMDIEIWENNGNWTGSLTGMTSIFGLQFATELNYANGKLHFLIGKNFDDMLKIFRNSSEYKVLPNSIEQSITLPSMTEGLVFGVGGNTQLPEIYLQSPTGEIISSTNIGSFEGIIYIENDQNMVSLFMLDSASAGKWTIGVSNLSSSDVNFGIFAKRVLPQTSFTQVTRSGNKLNIKASVIPARNDITVSLYFSERSSGGTGSLIVENLNAASGTISTDWDTSSMASGTYYIYAKTYDNLNAPVLTYYDSSIVIDNSSIQAPQNLNGSTSGDTVELTWTPSKSSSVIGYKVLYTDEPNIGGYKYQKSTILNNKATIEDLNVNKTYRFCVVAFDNNGNLSTESNTYTTGSFGTPEIGLSPNTFYFGGTSNGYKTGSQVLIVSNKGSGSLNWTVSTDQNWFSCSPISGEGYGIVTVSVNPTGLAAGTYTGTITVSDPNAANSPQTSIVILNVYNSNQSSMPFGDFATPIDGSTVSGSIAVTGWVLDDIGVESVKIYRTEGNDKIYIGDAVFVEGARPDVEQAYPTYPNNYKAGWGYMLLTNFLPNNGNGIFTLHAIATDMEGNHATLGTKTILVDNANAVKPFGAIDTPTQGGTASGSNFRNWGWVLTPQPYMIPTNGTTIDVWIDGIKLGHPIYNIYRSDIASLFPGYANSNGAAGYFDIDTTVSNNGVHSIQWTAVDSGGNTDGIGSRYFTIQNTGSSRSSSTVMKKTFAPGYKDLIDIPISYDEPIEFKKGYTDDYWSEELFPDTDGITYIQCKELERIDIQVTQAGMEVEGYMMVGNRMMSLPVGSTLEKIGGRFRWIPGPGFVGTYSLVFVEINKYGEKSRKHILVTIDPKFSRE
jgi:Leucine-rich repeat (LRR) protein